MIHFVIKRRNFMTKITINTEESLSTPTTDSSNNITVNADAQIYSYNKDYIYLYNGTNVYLMQETSDDGYITGSGGVLTATLSDYSETFLTGSFDGLYLSPVTLSTQAGVEGNIYADNAVLYGIDGNDNSGLNVITPKISLTNTIDVTDTQAISYLFANNADSSSGFITFTLAYGAYANITEPYFDDDFNLYSQGGASVHLSGMGITYISGIGDNMSGTDLLHSTDSFQANTYAFIQDSNYLTLNAVTGNNLTLEDVYDGANAGDSFVGTGEDDSSSTTSSYLTENGGSLTLNKVGNILISGDVSYLQATSWNNSNDTDISLKIDDGYANDSSYLNLVGNNAYFKISDNFHDVINGSFNGLTIIGGMNNTVNASVAGDGALIDFSSNEYDVYGEGNDINLTVTAGSSVTLTGISLGKNEDVVSLVGNNAGDLNISGEFKSSSINGSWNTLNGSLNNATINATTQNATLISKSNSSVNIDGTGNGILNYNSSGSSEGDTSSIIGSWGDITATFGSGDVVNLQATGDSSYITLNSGVDFSIYATGKSTNINVNGGTDSIAYSNINNVNTNAFVDMSKDSTINISNFYNNGSNSDGTINLGNTSISDLKVSYANGNTYISSTNNPSGSTLMLSGTDKIDLTNTNINNTAYVSIHTS